MNTVWIPILLTIYNLTANLSNDIYLPSLPRLVEVFSSSAGQIQLTMAMYYAGGALPQLLFGPLSDRYGRRPVLFGGGICFAIATLSCMLSPNIFIFLIGRFFQGVGVCSVNITTLSIVSDLYHGYKKIRITTYINICSAVAPLLGPIIGGYIFIWFGWRANFLLIFLMLTTILICLWFKLRESQLQLNITALQFKQLGNNYFLLLQNRQLMKCALAYCFLLGGLIAYIAGSAFVVIEILGVSPQHFGFSQGLIFLSYILAALISSAHKNEGASSFLVIIGMVFVTVGGLSLVVASFICGNSLLSFVVPLMLFFAGFGLCGNLFLAQAMSSFNENLKGYAAGLLGFGASVAAVLSSILVGIFYNGTMLSVAGLIALMIFAGVVSFFLFVKPQELPT